MIYKYLNNLEAIWLELCCLKIKYFCFVSSTDPGSPSALLGLFTRCIDLAWDTDISNLIIAGDLNADFVRNQTH